MGLKSTHTPQTTPLDDDPLHCLRLIRSRRVGAVTWHRLMAEHGTARRALAALPQIARDAGLESYAPFSEAAARDELRHGQNIGAKLLVHGQPDYPKTLCDIADAPPVLWCLGTVDLLATEMVALVGARNASSLGLRMATTLAKGLGEAGYVTVSGLARGIDRAAHTAALPFGSVAVLAGGVDIPYPEENAALYRQLCQEGCVLSEQPPGMAPQARHFPLRNRIISGLSRAVVVVEAASRSGSLLTARAALDQGREVLAVPGHPVDARAAGCNMLIRDGATLIRSSADVLEVIGTQSLAPPRKAPLAVRAEAPAALKKRSLADITKLHSLILQRLSPSPLAEDQLIRDLSLPAATVAQHLLDLELDGKVTRAPGGLLSRGDVTH